MGVAVDECLVNAVLAVYLGIGILTLDWGTQTASWSTFSLLPFMGPLHDSPYSKLKINKLYRKA